MPYNPHSKATTPVPDGLTAINVNLTYPVAVLNHTVFVTRLIPDLLKTGGGVEKYQVLAANSATRGLHSLIRGGIHPKFKEEYLENSEKILVKLSDRALLNSKENRFELIEKNFELLDLITDHFGAAGILPAIDETTDLGTLETQTRKQNEKVLRIAVFLLQKHGKRLFEMVKTDKEIKLKTPEENIVKTVKDGKEVFESVARSGKVSTII